MQTFFSFAKKKIKTFYPPLETLVLCDHKTFRTSLYNVANRVSSFVNNEAQG